MAIDGVFFDLYGTLLVYGDMSAAWPAWLAALDSWLRDQGLVVEPAELSERCQGFFSRPIRIPSGTGPDPERAVPATPYEQRLLSLWVELDGDRKRPSQQQLTAGAEVTAAAWQRFMSLDPDALPVLTELGRSRSLALISNFDHPPHVARLLDDSGLRSHFAVVTISGDLGIKKPDPGIFAPAIEALQLDPARVVYVGDAPEDVMAAKAAGLTPIRIQRQGESNVDRATDFRHAGPQPWPETRDLLRVKSLPQLPVLLESL